ncbi:metal activated pyridoxal enzyme [Vibrio sp. vnigr-6D03]|uniref:alanine racemase n=1 Tax=Vibrio sp. vnigr-6D03 TaxID=2058088 RepID=UPI000C348A76|nr:alanine racemase [Vibrio sp. vnigr-6D03]PKF79705.1 metal activated pyridoxal enzyme [Vibrio sp. vnigr-6D03]
MNQDRNEQPTQLDTPYLRLDKAQFLHNILRLRQRMESHGVALRPHLKTVRSVEATHHVLPEKHSPATVSTLKEAEVLAASGYREFIYAVGITASKLPRIQSLLLGGVDIAVILDSVEQAKLVAAFCQKSGCAIPALIELDCDGHRGGIRSDSLLLVEIAHILQYGGAEFRGVLTHAGESYFCQSEQELAAAAKQEVECARRAAKMLADNRIECKVVSVGSTPTAFSGEEYDGITEVRAGVYCFFDLVMAKVGVCEPSDIALSVVTSVIGHNVEKGWLIVDAGWMALSSDPGLSLADEKDSFGLVTDVNGNLVEGLRVSQLNQEHGIIEHEKGQFDLSLLPVGTQLRILPNHACATASMHQTYHVVDVDNSTETWQRIQGW